MLIACVRMMGEGSTSLFLGANSDWDLLKLELVKNFGVEGIFDQAMAWERLGEGKIVSDGTVMFQVFNTFDLDGEEGTIQHLTAFNGELMDIIKSEL